MEFKGLKLERGEEFEAKYYNLKLYSKHNLKLDIENKLRLVNEWACMRACVLCVLKNL